MKLNFDILDKERKILFEKLIEFKRYGYLAGGTALALQFGHRISYDFDIFCVKPISKELIKRIREEFKISEIIVNNTDEFSFFTKEDVKISFVYYPFDLSEYVLKRKECINILSATGVATAKAYALNRRNTWRDYVDIYFILKNKTVSLKKILKISKLVYEEMFSEKMFLAQLVYTEDISKEEIKNTPILAEKVNIKKLTKFFEKEIKKLI